MTPCARKVSGLFSLRSRRKPCLLMGSNTENRLLPCRAVKQRKGREKKLLFSKTRSIHTLFWRIEDQIARGKRIFSKRKEAYEMRYFLACTKIGYQFDARQFPKIKSQWKILLILHLLTIRSQSKDDKPQDYWNNFNSKLLLSPKSMDPKTYLLAQCL